MSKYVYTAGRPPWYDSTGSLKQPFLIGVAGGTASGKTTVCKNIIEKLRVRWVLLLSMDSFYRVLSKEELDNVSEYNFDHPNAFDIDLMISKLKDLKEGKPVEVPIYDFKTHSRLKENKTYYGADVIIFEGILTFYFEELRNMMDLKIFVDEDSDIRLARRLQRDIKERGRTVIGVLTQYEKFVKPAFDNYIYPTKKYADIIIPRGGANIVAIELISEHIRNKLQARGLIFEDLVKIPSLINHLLPPNVFVMKSSNQTKEIHTIIRDKNTKRSDFIFHSERLSRLLIEEALCHLPFQEKEIITPTGSIYKGIEFNSQLCGVSIMRAGEAMETPLREVCGGIPILKLLIQSDEKKEPRLFYCKLVKDLSQRKVFLLDPLLGTGATAMMAIRVLIDHGVEQENIFFLNLISSRQGIGAMSYTFPKIKIITTEIDDKLNEKYFIIPGIGNFGDRYFGTD
jgi:uridine kinase